MTTTQLIEQALTNTFHPASLNVFDDRAEHVGHAHQDSGHFTVEITAAAFKGKNIIEQHRMVYDALGSLMQTHIHALRIKASAV